MLGAGELTMSIHSCFITHLSMFGIFLKSLVPGALQGSHLSFKTKSLQASWSSAKS